MSDIWDDGSERDTGWEQEVVELQGLIHEQGLLQPIGLREKPGPNGGKYKLVFGRRRREACRRLKWTRIEAKIAPKRLTLKEEFFWKLTENSGRKDLRPLEEARAFHRAIHEDKITTAKELAEKLCKTGGYVSQRLQLLKLPENVRKAVSVGKITATHAREIARVTDEEMQKKLLSKAETMPVTDFKDHVAQLGKDKKKDSARGRKIRADKPVSVGEKSGVRSEKEVMKALGELDVQRREAREKNNGLREEYFKGMVRGIAWVRKMGGVKKLY